MIVRFKKDELGYTMASREFRTQAGKCGNDRQKQVARVQHAYDLICNRHKNEDKFLRGVDRAFKEFYTQTLGCSPRPTYRDDDRENDGRPAPKAPMASPRYEPEPIYVPAPPSPPRWDASYAPQNDGAPGNEVEMPYWQAQYENTETSPFAELASNEPKAYSNPIFETDSNPYQQDNGHNDLGNDGSDEDGSDEPEDGDDRRPQRR